MATRARVGILNKDGTVTSIYTHWDGYPEHHLPILESSFNDEKKIRELLSYGDCSELNDSIETCVFYERDKGELEGTEAVTHSRDEWIDDWHEYEYLFEDGKWKTL